MKVNISDNSYNLNDFMNTSAYSSENVQVNIYSIYAININDKLILEYKYFVFFDLIDHNMLRIQIGIGKNSV